MPTTATAPRSITTFCTRTARQALTAPAPICGRPPTWRSSPRRAALKRAAPVVGGDTIAALSRPSPKLAVGDWIGRKNRTTQTTKQPNPAFFKQGQAPGDAVARPSTAAPLNSRTSPTQPDHRTALAPTCSSWPAPSNPHNAAAPRPDSPVHRRQKARITRPARYGRPQTTPTPLTCPAGNPPSPQTPYSRTR